MIKKEGGQYKLSDNSNYKIQITAENTTNNKKLYTEIIKLSEFSNSVFGSANVNATAKISMTPIKFNDKKMGAIVGQINYSGSETSPTYTLSDHWLLELSGSDKIKLKDDYFYDMNRNAAVKDESVFKFSDTNNTNAPFNITAKNANGTKNLNIETFTLGDILVLFSMIQT